MNVKEIVGHSEYKKGYFRRRRILRMLIIITGLASIMLVVLTYYGHNAGNFVIKVSDSANRAIAISESFEGLTSNPQTRLQTPAIRDASDMAYVNLDRDGATRKDGAFVDRQFNYLAFTFYCMNVGQRTGTLVYSIRITEAVGSFDAGLRVMTIEEDSAGSTKEPIETVWRKFDPAINAGIAEEPDSWPLIFQKELDFESAQIVFTRDVQNFIVRDYRKFTIFVWLEGNDPDTTMDIRDGRVKLDMTLSINPNDI